MFNFILIMGAVLCALQAILTKRLIRAALWLAGVSALISLVLYQIGAHEVAVIELSVGAGLVTILFVFGISIAGEDAMDAPGVTPRFLSSGLALLLVALLVWFILPVEHLTPPQPDTSFSVMLWEERGLDMLVQIGLIFAGVLGVLGLLADEVREVQRQLGEEPETETAVSQPEPALPASDVQEVSA